MNTDTKVLNRDKKLSKRKKKLCKRFRFLVGFVLGVFSTLLFLMITAWGLYLYYEPWKAREKGKWRELYRGAYNDGQFIIQKVVNPDDEDEYDD